MRATAVERARGAKEPFPWFLLVLIALANIGLVATSAARIFQFHVTDAGREQRWRAEHEALVREATAPAEAQQ